MTATEPTSAQIRRVPRAVRAAMPVALDVVVEAAKQNGVCTRPLEFERLDLHGGRTERVLIPCGARLASVCEPCARQAATLRRAQCREGWHLAVEPVADRDVPNDHQMFLATERADAQRLLDRAHQDGGDTATYQEVVELLDGDLNAAGVRGRLALETPARRARSTRRRQDAPDLPRRRVEPRTVGRTYTGADGRGYRPSLFVTLTCDTYGKVKADGTPVNQDTYDYRRAARDAIHFPRVVDRFVQNLRRVAGFDVQYFAAVEPQRRLAPHLHLAMRGTMPRADVKAVAAATYHQVWWPSADVVRFAGDHLPVWAEGAGYLDPDTGEVLPTWDEALDDLDDDPDAVPFHVVRLGPQVDVKGVLAGSPDAGRCLSYLSKYLTKSVADCHEPDTDAQRRHVERLMDVLRYEPCSPSCPNWLRYGVQPKDAKPGMAPGRCRGKAHKPAHLGYAGRRVLVSRKWSGKTLAEHRADRRAWVLEQLGVAVDSDHDPDRYLWRPIDPGSPKASPLAARLLRAIADRQRWRAQLQAVQDGQPPTDIPATREAA
ncbi:replication initiator [Rhizohabitans arisaemae]|uniref:replication initiator n=1 Tax=Rhizohabitans arisaemae TaxID=2720610 RepID=UPI0024B23C30|nr:replication initiator [Rhizohabitans arisaemae]